MKAAPADLPSFAGVRLAVDGPIGRLTLARPASSNAFDAELWRDLPLAVEALETSPSVRVILLTGDGKNFCAGIDIGLLAQRFASLASGGGGQQGCPAVQREELRQGILAMQAAYTALERCRWPVVAAVQGACFGAGVDLITACDVRLCSEDARFCVKEVDLGITADIGTLQRLPSIVGHGRAAELSLTACTVSGRRAEAIGLVSACLPDGMALSAAAETMAKALASKPPLALQGTKRILLHTRDNPDVPKGLEHVALHNAAFLLSNELAQRVAAARQGASQKRSKL